MFEITDTSTLILLVSAFFTSMLSSVLGMGGGVSLLAVMMLFFPPTVLIPVHGIVQLFSNGVRTLIYFKSVVWYIFLPIAFGGLFGAYVGSKLVLNIPNEVYRPMLAIFLLFLTWRPKSAKKPKKFKFKFYIVGFF